MLITWVPCWPGGGLPVWLGPMTDPWTVRWENWTSVLCKPLCLCVLCYRNLACILYYSALNSSLFCPILSVSSLCPILVKVWNKIFYLEFVNMLLNQEVREVYWRFGDNSTSHIRQRTALLITQYRILHLILCRKVSESYLVLWAEFCPQWNIRLLTLGTCEHDLIGK